MAERKAPIKNSIVRDAERFHYTIELLKRENFDLCGLNEVTPEFLFMLQRDLFFREFYFFSDLVIEEGEESVSLKTRNATLGKDNQGNLILSKYLPLEMFKLDNSVVKNPVLYCTLSHSCFNNKQEKHHQE